ncbi:S-adenosyl-L-methionine-dependent methyltransferase [Xylogone sp. PMI_703]|nr:S-adenosyl-L-methionine-dependent methyltransferase [Xylogone sp. PMI_703]
MEYMIRFTHVHEEFRLAEVKALAVLEGIDLEILSYSQASPICIVKLPSEEAASRLVRRSILVKAIYELWGMGSTYPELHASVRKTSQHLWPSYKKCSFKFSVDSFQASRPMKEQRELIESLSFLPFEGPIKMKDAEQEFYISEIWPQAALKRGIKDPEYIYFGRYIGGGIRDVIAKYDLKKRRYISTTSMDAELALITANITLADTGKLFYDPFTGTGGFMLAAAHFGAEAFGSDIDGRSIRGKGKATLLANFKQYALVNQFGDTFVADITNTPLRAARLFDGILCDPPYGVREGLKVLGSKYPTAPKVPIIKEGEDKPHHLQDDYIPPKRPYGFLQMLDDILDFAALSLVDNGRLSFWMPTANDEDVELSVPQHPWLVVTSVCTQAFNKWSRRLITYRRLPDSEVDKDIIRERRTEESGVSADDLNPFRKKYFKGFKPEDPPVATKEVNIS